MNVLLSLVRKDLRLLRWPWLGYLAVLQAKIALGTWYIVADMADAASALRLDTALTGAAGLLAYILTLRLVQADAPLRINAFWHTRPISGAHLLAAKACTAFVLFGLSAVLVALPWWLANGLGGHDLALAAFELLLGQTLLILPALLIASLVDSFARAVLWSIVQYGVLIGLVALVRTPFEQPLGLAPGLILSRWMLALGIVALALPVLITWQYLRRRQIAVIAGLGLLHVAVLATLSLSPYNFQPPAARWTELRPELGREVRLLPPYASYQHSRRRGSAFEPPFLREIWPVTGLPTDLIVRTRLTSLVFAEATLKPAFPEVYSWPGAELTHRRINEILAIPPFASLGKGESARIPSIVINHQLTAEQVEQAAKVKLQAPVVTTSLRISLDRPKVVQNQAITPGLWWADRGGGLRVTGISPTPDGIHLRLVTTAPRSIVRQLLTAWRDLDDPDHTDTDAPTHRDFLFHPTVDRANPLTASVDQMSIFGVGLARSEGPHHRPTVQRNGKWVPLDIDLAVWRAGLRIARITYHEEARFEIQGRTEGLVIEGSPEPPDKTRP